MSEKTCFKKPVLSLDEQVALLISRGMTVKNEESAMSFLRDVNYYRFSGYAIYYEIFQDGQRTHVFKPGTEFEKVKNIYWFDSELRSILFQAIEPIEIMISVRDEWMKFVENTDKIAVYFPLLIHLHSTLCDDYDFHNIFDEFINNYKENVDLRSMGFKQ